MIEHWNGHSWRAVRSPAPHTGLLDIYGLNAIACPSTRRCWAIGGYYAGPASFRPLIERWNGRRWSLVRAAGTGGVTEPLGITCPARGDCWAVGYTFPVGHCPASGCGWYSLIEHWDGRRWRRVSSPDPARGSTTATLLNILQSVACTSRNNCWAAGYEGSDTDGNRFRALLLRWNGRRWSAHPAPADTAEGGDALLGIACGSGAGCLAVGTRMPLAGQSSDLQPLAERWDGSGWKMATGGQSIGTSQGELLAVSCSGRHRCVAVGNRTDALGGSGTLIDRWNGSAWNSATSPSPKSSQGTLLDSVACRSISACVAGGFYSNSLGVLEPLAQNLGRGRWRTTLARFVGGASAVFSAVACASSTRCWSVGYDLARVRTLTSRWNGRRWRIVATPTDSSAIGEGLLGATCLSRANCWAVGWTAKNGGTDGLVQHWNGSRWRDVSSPAVNHSDASWDAEAVGVDGASVSAYLSSVACASPDECWAVGTVFSGAGMQPLLERWNGASWSLIAPSAALAQSSSYLSGVTCSSASDCWAVGGYWDGASVGTVTEHWNGTAWIPSLGLNHASLSGVTCRSRSDCWAVGTAGSQTSGQPLAEHWNGSSWRTFATPASDVGTLASVACLGPRRCWAVGAQTPGWLYDALLEAWNGRHWSDSRGASVGGRSTGSVLSGITCTRRRGCWAVGWSYNRALVHTLAEHH